MAELNVEWISLAALIVGIIFLGWLSRIMLRRALIKCEDMPTEYFSASAPEELIPYGPKYPDTQNALGGLPYPRGKKIGARRRP